MRPVYIWLWCCVPLLLVGISTAASAAISDEGRRSVEQLRHRLQSAEAESTNLNPAALVATVKDYYPPIIHNVYAVKHGSDEGVALDGNNRTLSGKIDIVIGANDRMNRSAYQHALYTAAWSLDRLNADGSANSQIPEQEVFRFDRLPFTGERVQLSLVIYRDSLRLDSGRVRANGADGPRFFLINLTSGTTASGYSPTNHLDTTRLANGRYRLTIKVTDSTGNPRQKSVEFQIRN